jgi:carbon monoxide dehydrogenase subunit G
MAHIESTLFVPKSPEDVFAFLNAPESHAKFIPNMAEFKQTTSGAFGKVGATAQGLLSYFELLKIGVRYEIIEHELNHRLAMKGEIGPINFKDGYILKKADHGTKIRFWLDLFPTGWAKLLFPFMGLIGKIHAWETLRNLKREISKIEVASPGDASQPSGQAPSS